MTNGANLAIHASARRSAFATLVSGWKDSCSTTFPLSARRPRTCDILGTINVSDWLDAWKVNDLQNHALLRFVGDSDFDLKPGKGKTIRSNYVHLIGVRRSWIEVRSASAARGLPKLDWKTATREEIVQGLEATNAKMLELFETMATNPKPGKWTLAMFFAYCIAHEAHHRSQIEIALRLGGRELADLDLYSLWDWPKVLQSALS